MHILSFHKATYPLFQGIHHKNLDATPSLSKDLSVIAYTATLCVLHPSSNETGFESFTSQSPSLPLRLRLLLY